MSSILVIDDDTEFCLMLRDYLAPHNIRLAMQHDGEAGLRDLRSNPYDMILLDIMLPGRSGLEILTSIRSFSSLRVLILSALSSQAARIAGLDEGADDYLPKPFDPRELVSRIWAVLRRQVGTIVQPADLAGSGTQGLQVNRAAREAYFRSTRLPLTDVEYCLLSIFLDSPGIVVAREDLVGRIFQRPFDPMDRSLDVHVSRLRKKLELLCGLTNPIKSIRNSGYLFSADLAR
jgi:two-component system response regulator CpxR